MGFTNQSPLIPVGGSQAPPMPVQVGNSQGISPEQWEYIQQVRRTGYDPNQLQTIQQNYQYRQPTDPYTDFSNEFKQCSQSVQKAILSDYEFSTAMAECDKQIQSMMEQMVRPYVMQTPDGRVAFEKMLAQFRETKNKFANQEAKNMEKIQMLMNDEVVKKRMQEIETGGVSNGK